MKHSHYFKFVPEILGNPVPTSSQLYFLSKFPPFSPNKSCRRRGKRRIHSHFLPFFSGRNWVPFIMVAAAVKSLKRETPHNCNPRFISFYELWQGRKGTPPTEVLFFPPRLKIFKAPRGRLFLFPLFLHWGSLRTEDTSS